MVIHFYLQFSSAIMLFIHLLIFACIYHACDGQVIPKLFPFTPQTSILNNSSFTLFCSANAGDKPLFFQWSKDGKVLSNHQSNYKIENSERHSLFTIESVVYSDAGNYTCIVRNAYGEDTMHSQLIIRVPLKWIKEPENLAINYGESAAIECEANGVPKSMLKWVDSKGNYMKGDILRLRNVVNSSTYECIADNGVDTALRKVIKISVRVPAKFDEKYSMIQVKSGESARITCNATGDQPLSIVWTKDNVKLDKLGANNYEIFDKITDTGLVSELVFRSTQRTDGSIYKCNAENEHGKDERRIKLVIVEVPERPVNVRVKEVWSRTASVLWSAPYSGNSPLTKYTVQYWRRENAPQRLHELTVSSSQTSVMIKDLSPGTSYELNVVGENEVGRGQASDTVTFVTGEEEPSLPPNDITVQALGPTTIRVTWRAPPIENWNGVIKGYYIGYRKSHDSAHPYTLKLVEARKTQNGKTAEIITYEYFLRDLTKATEYAVIVKAYNSAGSGPQSHEVVAHTLDGDLPAAQHLSAFDSTDDSVSVRWYQKDNYLPQSQPISSYTVHYQREGEPKWIEVPFTVFATPTPSSESPSLASYSYVIQNLDSGTQYKIFVTAVNRYGVSDPSNIVVAKTGGDREIYQSDYVYPLYDTPYYLQPSFTIPILTAIVIIIIVILVAFICVRKIRRSATDGLIDSATLSKQFASYAGTTPRYMDFDKTSGKPLMMTEQANLYPTPYATMPMGATGDSIQKPWDRPLPSLKKESHIYDHPQ